ncbi:MAG: hypothetical protein HRU18_02740 [Pseudoalteromonas sp.]|uniref:hypothetical protein n=1 Tax=Pseudoalteromonas sp. TaxID=53249 RepID=UPI001E1200F6|nr:hypothetical protein [Pseudoalteromonas sp.]NRA77101.1 hypothetical protein [Pseudoalteromonas sp.]
MGILTRHRYQHRFLRSPLLVLQVYDRECVYKWRDATVEDLELIELALKTKEKEDVPIRIPTVKYHDDTSGYQH